MGNIVLRSPGGSPTPIAKRSSPDWFHNPKSLQRSSPKCAFAKHRPQYRPSLPPLYIYSHPYRTSSGSFRESGWTLARARKTITTNKTYFGIQNLYIQIYICTYISIGLDVSEEVCWVEEVLYLALVDGIVPWLKCVIRSVYVCMFFGCVVYWL